MSLDFHMVVCWAGQLIDVLVEMTVEWWAKLTAFGMVELKAL